MKLAIAGLIMIMISGIMFFLFVGFNYAFHSDGGLQDTLWESANKTLSGSRKTQFDELMPQISQGFGMSCVLCLLVGVGLFIVDAFHKPPEAGGF